MDRPSITGKPFEHWAWVQVIETLQRNSIDPQSYDEDDLADTAWALSWGAIGPARIVEHLLYLASPRPGPIDQQQWYQQGPGASSPIPYSAGPAVAGPSRAAAHNGMPPASTSPHAAAAAYASAPTANNRSPSNTSDGRFSNPSVLGLSEGRKFPSRTSTMSSEATSVSSSTPGSEAIRTRETTPLSTTTSPPRTPPYRGQVPNSSQACSRCGNMFLTDSDRCRHEELVCGCVEARPVAANACSMCGKVFTKVGNRRRHEDTVCSDNLRYECLTCRQLFKRKYNMKAHMKREHK